MKATKLLTFGVGFAILVLGFIYPGWAANQGGGGGGGGEGGFGYVLIYFWYDTNFDGYGDGGLSNKTVWIRYSFIANLGEGEELYTRYYQTSTNSGGMVRVFATQLPGADDALYGITFEKVEIYSYPYRTVFTEMWLYYVEDRYTRKWFYNETIEETVLFMDASLDTDVNGIADTFEQQLVEKFAPSVYMNYNNHMFPSPVEALTDNTSLCYWLDPIHEYFWIFYDKDQDGISAQEAFEIADGYWDSDWWMDFGGENAVTNADDWHNYWDSIKNNYLPTVYAHSFMDNFGHTPVIQYWFFYPYNDWAGDHEGDWEHINVKVSDQVPSHSNPLEVVFYFHYKRKTLPWSSTEHSGNHPIVHVGGHAEKYVLGQNQVHGWESGGSYPYVGLWEDVAAVGTDERISDIGTSTYIDWSEFNVINMTNNYNLWWMKFPGHWGVPLELVSVGWHDVPRNGPYSPPHHECWEVYLHDNYPEY